MSYGYPKGPGGSYCPKCGKYHDQGGYAEPQGCKEYGKEYYGKEYQKEDQYEDARCYPSPKRGCMLPPEAVREIRLAIDDELAAVSEYATLARKFKCNPTLQAWITSIAGDEYGHARAFSMILAAAGCLDTKGKCED